MPTFDWRWVAILPWALGVIACDRALDSRPQPGTALYAVATENILELTLTSADRRVYAFRWALDEPFQILSVRPGADAERCRAGEGFARVLAAVSRLDIVAEEAGRLDQDDRNWARLSIADSSGLDPVTTRLRIPSGDEPVLVLVADRQFSVGAKPDTLRLLTVGCQGLGEGSKP